ncbi:hypothetical protein Xish_02130 [Xenorhabdus ishibashii]|uniref:Uncharacterized protein n=1 Tax=Xenorhabdus ishibashii TaxID=1034471 RepID=A0A2D0KHI7_9GAMM|nr:hypothetical protein Xish_02130 [Xenorhabdus ishibashii]
MQINFTIFILIKKTPITSSCKPENTQYKSNLI